MYQQKKCGYKFNCPYIGIQSTLKIFCPYIGIQSTLKIFCPYIGIQSTLKVLSLYRDTKYFLRYFVLI